MLLLFLQYFCTGVASVFTQTTAFTLFLGEFDSRTLPLTYIAMAVTVSLLTFAYLQAGRRLTFSGSLKANLGSLLLIIVLFALGLAVTDARWLIFALPVLFQIVVVFGNMAFWSLAGRILNVRQGKRLFGLVGAGEWSAIVIMGFLTPLIAPRLGLTNLLWIAAIGMLGGFLTMLTTLRLYHRALAEPVEALSPSGPRPVFQPTVWGLLSHRYVVLIFALTLLWWVGFFFVDNIFYDRAAEQFPEADELAGFLGIYLGGLGILTLFSNFFIASRIIGRFGLRATLLILPVGLTVGALVMTAAGVLSAPLAVLFWAAVVTKVWGLGVGFSIDQAARSVLYQPLSATLRTRVQTLADGVVQPVATGLAGVALLVIGAFFPAGPLPLILGFLVLAVALLAVAIPIGRDYARVLTEALTRRRLSGNVPIAGDAISIAVLKAGLRSPHAGVVVHSLRVLGEVDATKMETELPALLSHATPEVRRLSLEHVARGNPISALPLIRERVRVDASPDVRGLALRILAGVDGDREALSAIDDPHPTVRRGAIVGLLTDGGTEGARAASRRLRQLIESANPLDRVEAAEILAECGIRTDPDPLLNLLRDRDWQVRRSALMSAGRVRDPRLWPVVVEELANPATRSAAAAALVHGGEAALAEIQKSLTRSTNDRDTLIGLVKVCGLVGGPLAVGLLRGQINAEDPHFRSAILGSLSRCGYRAPRKDAPEMQRLLRTEIAHAAWLLAAATDVGAGPQTLLLQSALAQELAGAGDRILDLLSFRGDAAAVARARDNLLRGSADKVAYALEVIDIQTPPALKGSILPLFQPATGGQRLPELGREFGQKPLGRGARVQELSLNAEHKLGTWTQACALYAAGRLALPNLPAVLGPHLAAEEPLIRDTARWLHDSADIGKGDDRMLSTIEKVLILRTVSIFAATPDEILADVAAVSAVSEAPAGTKILEKGSQGDSLYIVASGSVCVHDGAATLNRLVAGDVFGEMAVLDPEPRSASVTAIEDTQFLCLDQQALYELIDIRPEIARGLLKVLSQRLRGCLRDLSDLRGRQGEPLLQ